MKRKNMYRNVGSKKIHVNQLAAMSRKYTVSNNTIPKLGLNGKNIITVWNEIRTTKYDTPVYGKMFEIDKDGHYHVIEREFDPTPLLLSHKQPKNLHKKQKYWRTVGTTKQYVSRKSEYPDYLLPKLNKVEYMEKLVEHKTAKWERKNPCPVYSPDLFYSREEFNKDEEKWKQLRETMKERFRDFVVSIYDPLPLTGRFVIAKENSATYQEEKVAELKDINGEGHKVNDLPKDSKLIKKAQKVTNETKAKRPNLVATNLKDHKRQKGRIILPQAA